MEDSLEEIKLGNQKWKNKVSKWMHFAEFHILISLMSIIFLYIQMMNNQNELKSVTSKLLELQNIAATSDSSCRRIDKKMSSLDSWKDDLTKRVDKFENDMAKLRKPNYSEKHLNDDYVIGSRYHDLMMPKFLQTQESIHASDYTSTFQSARIENELFLRRLEESHECKESSVFEVIIYLDDDYHETSWTLIEASSNTTNEVIFHEKIREPSSNYTFIKCLGAGSYIFSIHDSFGDGISCRDEPACYEIRINNIKIDGSLFSSEYNHTFSISPVDQSLCIGHNFHVNFELDKRFDGAKWTLLKRDEKIEEGSIDMPYDSFSFSTCIEPGYYHFMVVDSEGEEIFCERNSKCIQMKVDNRVIKNIRIYEVMRQSFLISFEGIAITPKCLLKPLLAPVENFLTAEYDNDRIEGVMNIITSLSSMSSLNDRDSAQYNAACFILFDDVLELSAQDVSLAERYALAVLLFATRRHAFVELPSDTCKYRDVECDINGAITKLNWGGLGLSGFMPSEIAQLRNLESIRLDSNDLKGTIPTELGLLFYLRELRLTINDFYGSIPSQLGNLHLLNDLRIGGNNFTGSSIPSEIGNCGSLKFLGLTFAGLEGTIPPELFHAKRLEWISLGTNKLTGTMPRTIGQLKRAKLIALNDNKLHGSIPTEVGGLSSIWHLRFTSNILSGAIPSQLQQCSYLRELQLGNNKLSGSIPDIFANLTHLHIFDVGNNVDLRGEIPSSLWENDFKIPPDVEQPEKGQTQVIGNVSSSVLSLQNTALEGTVPGEFDYDMDQLRVEFTEWFLDDAKIKCPNCKDYSQCYIWEIGANMTASCPSDSIKVVESDNFFFADVIKIQDKIANETLSLPVGSNTNTTLCLSPTGCYNVIANHNQNLGYKSYSHALEIEEGCDSVVICGNDIHPRHTKRKGLNHLMHVGVPNTAILDDPDSAHYKTLCWMMNEVNDAMPKDNLFKDYHICDGTLLQRFALGVFFFSQPESFRKNDTSFEDLGNTPSCQWHGITCDENKRFVESIKINDENLSTFVRELGFLNRLKRLDLSSSKLAGTLEPATFTSWPYLEYINLSNNSLEGQIPDDLLKLKNLKHILLNNNQFEGTLPMGASYPPTLNEINVGSNLLKGSIPEAIINCNEIENLNFSRNYFDGTISSGVGNMKKLKKISLSENLLIGSIPPELFDIKVLEVIMLQGNKLTGSIPSQLGSLSDLRIVSMSHNNLKGNIPISLENHENIVRLQLHQNQLKGKAPELKRLKDGNESAAYVTDCGQPNFALEEDLLCETCTMCCNSLSECQATQGLRISLNVAGGLCLVLIPLSVFLWHFIRLWLSRRFKAVPAYILKATPWASDSIYHFVHSDKIQARFLFFITAGFQLSLYYFYLAPSELTNEDTDYQFSFRCPPSNLMNCIEVDEVGNLGWMMFVFVTLIYLGPDFVMSSIQIRKAVYIKDFQLLLGGVLVLSLTSLAIFTSVVYNMALAASDTDLIMNAVILLFINDLDEKVLSIIQQVHPDWTTQISGEVKNKISRIDSEFMTRQNGSRHLEMDK